jgi:hypothetical protein
VEKMQNSQETQLVESEACKKDIHIDIEALRQALLKKYIEENFEVYGNCSFDEATVICMPEIHPFTSDDEKFKQLLQLIPKTGTRKLLLENPKSHYDLSQDGIDFDDVSKWDDKAGLDLAFDGLDAMDHLSYTKLKKEYKSMYKKLEQEELLALEKLKKWIPRNINYVLNI